LPLNELRASERADWVKLRESQKRLKEATRDHCNTTDRAGAYISRPERCKLEPHCEKIRVAKLRRASCERVNQRRSTKRLEKKKYECFIIKPTAVYYPSSR
jgi:hypothetical protein